MNTIKYIPEEAQGIKNQPPEGKNRGLLFFCIHWLKVGIEFGCSLLKEAEMHSTISPDEWFEKQEVTFSHLPPIFQDIAKDLKNRGSFKELENNYGWDSKSILEHTSMLLHTGNNSQDYFFFLHAINQANRFTTKLKEYCPILNVIIEKFNNELRKQKLKEVRDIYEHYDEYIIGQGRNPDKNSVLNEKESCISDATGVFIHKDSNNQLEITIGNRVKVRETVDISKETLIELILYESKLTMRST